MKKIFIVVAVFAVMVSASVVQAHMGDYYWARVVNCNEWISLREYPSTEAPRITKIPLGSLVKIYQGQLGERSSSPTMSAIILPAAALENKFSARLNRTGFFV